MQTIPYIDIFTCPNGPTEAMCVTTNGMIKKNGRAVMGRGIALSVNTKYHVDNILAKHSRTNGNIPADLGIYDGFHVLSFPTKNNWRDNSSIELIKNSAQELVKLADSLGLTKIYLTKPGCTNGHLDWLSTVKPEISNILDDRFIVIE